MAVIFDLDQTLVDSSCTDQLRRNRQWVEVYTRIPSYTVYNGVLALLEHLARYSIPMCVVTSSHSVYCGKVLDHFRMNFGLRVCYHDTALRKPNPEPILLGIQKLGVSPQSVISVGDDPRDIIASRAAHTFTVAALWGTVDRAALLATQPDAACETVTDLQVLLDWRLNLRR